MPEETIYLDFQATTPLDPLVREAMIPWMSGAWNPHATEHRLGNDALNAVETARGKVAWLLGCTSSEVTFTSGATESSNIVLRGVTNRGDSLAVSSLEHASVAETALALEKDARSLHLLDVDNQGILDPDSLDAVMYNRPKLLSLIAVNNEIGVIQPIEEVAMACEENGILFHSDMTQSIGRVASVLTAAPVDYASISSHKIYGPQGIGALYIRNGATAPNPLSTGGSQEKGLRPGTVPVASCVGFGVACELAAARRKEDFEHAEKLARIMLDGLAELDGWQVNGSMEHRIPHNLNITFDGVDAEILLARTPELALSTGSACSSGSLRESAVLKAIGLSDENSRGAVRIGLGRTTTDKEVGVAASMLCEHIRALRKAAA
ncbi:MAG: cysteine desulfurase family protein [Gammaproteobacteria bacterium]|nr:cysteine desulfurase family protein [Gammaproteobacteria bacterium]